MRLSLHSAVLIVGLITPAAPAQAVYTWTAGGATDQWSSGFPGGPFNWTAGGGEGLPPANAVITFTSPTQYQTVDLQVSRTVNSAQFGGTAAYTLTDGSLILGGGNVTVTGTAGAAVTHAINVPVLLGVSGSWSVDTSSLSLSGAITDGGNGYGITKTGSGTLTLTGASTYAGATNVDAGTLQVGTGGSLTNTFVTVGPGGTMNISGGSVTAGPASYFVLAGGSAPATVNLTAGSLTTAETDVGSFGTAVFTQTGGTHTVTGTGNLFLGVNTGASGTYALSGTGQLSASRAYVGYGGSGTFTQTGGTANFSGGLYLGNALGYSASYNLGGTGQLSAGATSFVGYSGPGTFTQTGGTFAIPSAGLVLGGNGGSGTYTLGGGTLQLSYVNQAGPGTFFFDGGTLKPNGNSTGFVQGLAGAYVRAGGAVFDTSGYSVTVPQALLHDSASLGLFLDGGLTKKGAGTLTLTGANTYTGGTVITGGILSVASDAALGDPAGAVTVTNSGQLMFSGSVTTSRELNLNSSSLAAPAGGTITLSGATVVGGFLRGPGTFVVTNGTAVSGATTFASTTVNQTGPGSYTNFSNGGSWAVAPGLAGPNTMNGFTNQTSGSITIGAGSAATAADFESYGTLTLTPNTTAAPTMLTNTGSSPLAFGGGSRTFIGTAATATMIGQPTFDAGIDLHGQNAVVAGGLFINNGYVADGSAAGTATIIADFGSLVKGAGYFQNSVITQNGGKFQAGNSPGSATFGNFVLGPGGVNSYVFAIDDATGTAGPHPNAAGQVSGWGLVSAVQQQMGSTTTSGNFTWTADPADKLTVALDTLVNPTIVGTDVAGPMADFDPSQAYSWPAVRWTGTYSGPTDVAALDAATSFDTSGFENPINGKFGWSLSGSSLTLSYTPTPVPEPGTLALTGIAAIGWVTFWRRRWQSNAPAATLAGPTCEV